MMCELFHAWGFILLVVNTNNDTSHELFERITSDCISFLVSMLTWSLGAFTKKTLLKSGATCLCTKETNVGRVERVAFFRIFQCKCEKNELKAMQFHLRMMLIRSISKPHTNIVHVFSTIAAFQFWTDSFRSWWFKIICLHWFKIEFFLHWFIWISKICLLCVCRTMGQQLIELNSFSYS